MSKVTGYKAARKYARYAFSAVLAASAVLAVAGCHNNDDPPLTAEQTEGQQFYNARCAVCHEQNAMGLQPAPPNLHGVFKNSTLTDAQAKQIILDGKGMMPSFKGRVTNDQMNDLFAYFHTSQFEAAKK